MKKIARRQTQGEGGTRRKKKKDIESDSESMKMSPIFTVVRLITQE